MRQILGVILLIIGADVWANPASELADGLLQALMPADYHSGLVNSQDEIDPTKVHGYAVIKKAGIPASYAFWYITSQDYEFRPLMIAEDAAKTHFGKVDHSLAPGTVMIVVDASVRGKTVNVKLLSREVMVPKDTKRTSHHTRVGASLVFKFPKLKMTAADLPTILARIEDYIAPAATLAQAAQLSSQFRQ